MNMQLLLGINLGCYFISLFLICLYKDRINTKVFNGIFIAFDLLFYLFWNISSAQNGGLKDGFMTLENISPYIFTIIPLTLFMNEKTKSYAYSAIAFLHFGMFAALLISPEYVVIFDYKTEASFWYASEAICHMLAALFGIYLIITRQVKTDFEHWVKSIVFMWGSITFGVILNLILDTRCFNMNPERYGIYMLDIFESYEATRLAYYLGVLLVLTLGMQIGHGLLLLVDKIKLHHSLHSHKE